MLHEILTMDWIINPQINYLLFIQKYRTPELDVFFLYISSLAFVTFPSMVFIFCYWFVDKKNGLVAMLSFPIGQMLIPTIKNFAHVERPWTFNSNLNPITLGNKAYYDYSFPSGHTIWGALNWGGLAIIKWKHKIFNYVFATITLLIAFSRNYLGVHTPQDIIAGLLIVFALFYIFNRILTWAEKEDIRYQILTIVSISVICIGFMVLNYLPHLSIIPLFKNQLYFIFAYFFGIITGYYVEKKYVKYEIPEIKIFQKLLIGFFGILLLMLSERYFTPIIFNLFKHGCGSIISGFLQTFYIVGLYPIFIKYIAKKISSK